MEMEAIGEAQHAQREARGQQGPLPSLYELAGYTVTVDFSNASHEPDRLGELVEQARKELSIDPYTDTSKIESEVERINLLDAEGLEAFAKVFVDAYMPKHTVLEGSCGITGTRYNNHFPGDTGLVLFKTRVKRGKNTLAKVFRKTNLDEEDVRCLVEREDAQYHADLENRTITYMMADTSATRAVFETDKGVEQMRAWVYKHPEMEVLSEEEKDKPTYKATHMQVKYRGVVRELQLMTAQAETVAKTDGYHGDAKNDVAKHACNGIGQ